MILNPRCSCTAGVLYQTRTGREGLCVYHIGPLHESYRPLHEMSRYVKTTTNYSFKQKTHVNTQWPSLKSLLCFSLSLPQSSLKYRVSLQNVNLRIFNFQSSHHMHYGVVIFEFQSKKNNSNLYPQHVPRGWVSVDVFPLWTWRALIETRAGTRVQFVWNTSPAMTSRKFDSSNICSSNILS